MKLEELKRTTRELAVVEATTAPVLSCYVNLEQGPLGYRRALDERIGALRRTLEPGEREAFEMAMARIEAFLGTAIEKSTRGVAIFARAIEGPIFHALQFRVPLPNRLSIDSFPSIYHLVELKDAYHRYVVLITTQEFARIIEVDVGGVTSNLWAERPELRERVGRIWSREHYQKHRRNRGDKFIKEKIQILDRVVSSGGHSHLILAGNVEAVARVRASLPRRLSKKLVDIVGASSKDTVSDVVAATLASFLEHEQQESVLTAGRLRGELRRGGLAVADSSATLQALRQGQVDLLVMADAYDPPAGWACRACGVLASESRPPAACPECGEREIQTADIKEEMMRLAEGQDARIEIVRESDALLDLGGVGCLLRYLTPGQRAESASITEQRTPEPVSRQSASGGDSW